MIVIADSGSTKCDWLIFDKTSVSDKISTMGFNPFFHSSELIESEILKSDELKSNRDSIERVIYFGAGCSSKERNQIVEKALQRVFSNATISVDHDLLGAAYACCKGKPGIACILGTGSNSCYFDGTKIYEEVPALGYILGDEGGGDYMGRKLLTRFLYKQLPDYLHNKLANECKLTKESIFKSVYETPNANVYMASFMKVLSEFKDEPYVMSFVGECMRDFLVTHVCVYDNHTTVPVNFIGSVAHYFQHILKKEADKLNIKIGYIEKKPIFALKDYFSREIYNSVHE